MNKTYLTSKKIALIGIIIALNLVLNFFLRVPTPTGFISLVETGIVLAAWNLGAKGGMLVGGLTGLLLDLLSGYPQWMLISLVTHGAEGAVFGYHGKDATPSERALTVILGGMVMVTGYFVGGIGLQLLNHVQLEAAIFVSLADVFGNLLQVFAGVLLATAINFAIKPMLAQVN
ncbi:MAG: ECF transporter S component [Lactobacillaceae bacterium]|jgi:uncharacterized membrane protein|nr:ECF transporter S component [Lactobacillaceae bacterium]